MAKAAPRRKAKNPSSQQSPKRLRPGDKIGAAMKKFQKTIAADRNLVSPGTLANSIGTRGIRTLLVPISDNGWAPAMWCGEFANVDTEDRQLRPDEFFLIRHFGGTLAIVRPRHHDIKQGIIQGAKANPNYVRDAGPDGGWYWDGLFWWFTYGAQTAFHADGKPFDADDSTEALLARFHMSDGPLEDRLARKLVVGRVTGVLGKDGRSMNWRHWAEK